MPMQRREFLFSAAAAPAALRVDNTKYQIVSDYKPSRHSQHAGMPGLYPGEVVSVKAPKIDRPGY